MAHALKLASGWCEHGSSLEKDVIYHIFITFYPSFGFLLTSQFHMVVGSARGELHLRMGGDVTLF